MSGLCMCVCVFVVWKMRVCMCTVMWYVCTRVYEYVYTESWKLCIRSGYVCVYERACMCMFEHMYVIYMHPNIDVWVCMYVCVQVYTCMCMFKYIHVCVCSSIYMYVYVQVYTCMCMFKYIHVCVCLSIYIHPNRKRHTDAHSRHTYIQWYMHTYTHAHQHSFKTHSRRTRGTYIHAYIHAYTHALQRSGTARSQGIRRAWKHTYISWNSHTETPTIIDPVALGYFLVALGSIIVGVSVHVHIMPNISFNVASRGIRTTWKHTYISWNSHTYTPCPTSLST